MNRRFLYIIAILLCGLPPALNAKIFSVLNLRCEQAQNPLGIETLQPRFSWQIYSDERNFQQSAYRILVATSPDELSKDSGTIWDSGKTNTSSSILVPFSGQRLDSGKTYYWKVKIWDQDDKASPWSQPQQFTMGLLTPEDWEQAQWIALENDNPGEIITQGIHGLSEVDKVFAKDKEIGMYKLPQFRKEFAITKEIKRAIAYVSGLGHFDLFLNGEKVGNHFLDPGWTKYDKCALYVPFDITSLLRSGQNAIGAQLGNGFFNIPRERYFKLLASYGAPRLLLCIKIEYTDGTRESVITDSSWKVSESPITYSSIYGGEDYDANKVQPGWNETGFDDHSWQSAIVLPWKTRLLAQVSAPLLVRDTLPAVRIFQNQLGRWVYDLGQNFSGIIRLSVNSNQKQEIRFHPAELLNPDSTVNQSASGAPYWLGYTSKGSGLEHWQPQFTYYGFRYVEIEGAVPAGMNNPQNLPEIVSLCGLHTCNSAEEVGSFHCSKPLFNKTYELIDWAIRSNMASVLTDCPHREKLGWLEQVHLMQYSVQYRYNLARMYEKIMNDIRSTQAENGMVPDIAPELVEFEGGFKDTPEWGSSLVISPWYIYLWYGDQRLIEEYYPDMQRYVDYLGTKADGHIVAYGLGDWFDIGPNAPGVSQLTSNGVTATAIYYYDVCLMSKMASLLGKTEDAMRYERLAQEIKKAFNRKFWNARTGQYDRNSQTANAIALYTGLVMPENRKQVYENLITDIRSRKNGLTAGDVGYRYVLRALEEGGFSELIFDMNSRYDQPGYGWQLAHGATALTESWQAYGFVSNNHFMLGHLMEWLFSGLGGIRQADNSIAYKQAIIRPTPVGDVRSARTTYQSPYGEILSEWNDSEECFSIRVEIPANSSARVYLPTSDSACITESGLRLIDSGIAWHQEDNYIIAEIGSGEYRFEVKK